MKKHQRAKRIVSRQTMLKSLILAGRQAECEIPGCSCMDPTELEIHHIIPVSFKPAHTHRNLAILCGKHHALIERFYFEKRARLMPEVATAIQEIARKFKRREFQLQEIEPFQQKTQELWNLFNSHSDLKQLDWWSGVWAAARVWSSQQRILTPVTSKDAITSEVWFEQA